MVHGSNPGPAPYLTSSEESELVGCLQSTAKIGYGMTRQQGMNIVERVAKEGLLKMERLTCGWFRRFKQRNPSTSLRTGDSMASVRFQCTTDEIIKEYFELLETVLQEFELCDKPGQIYNVDETGMSLDPPKLRVCALKGQKKVRQRGSANRSNITVVGSVSATGHIIPPFVIFEGRNVNHSLSQGEAPSSRYGTSPKGWIDTELFRLWFTDHFLRHATAARPLLLLMDGHSSHYQPALVRFAKENDVVILRLPSHTSADS